MPKNYYGLTSAAKVDAAALGEHHFLSTLVMSNQKNNIDDLFLEHSGILSRETIVQMAERPEGGNVHNVITLLNMHCFGCWVEKDQADPEYVLFYINGKNEIQGRTLRLTVFSEKRDALLSIFCKNIAAEFGETESIDAFNTFQQQTRTMAQKLGFTTISSNEIEHFSNATFVVPAGRGIVYITFLDKLKVYQELFEHQHNKERTPGTNYVYLMFNKKNTYIKIGKSIDPKFREKTLQAEEPDIEIITWWQAPAQKEKELHRLFINQKQRGEWFRLGLEDMHRIKEFMQDYA